MEPPANTGGASTNSYEVQLSTDGQTFSAVPSAELSFFGSSAIVTGLTDGTSYQFRVAAVNSAGEGSWSTPVAATPVSSSTATTSTSTQPPTAPADSDSTLPANTPGVSAAVQGNSTSTPASAGSIITLTGSGFSPSEEVAVWIFSSPEYLGQLRADQSGNINGQLTLPLLLAGGKHTLASVGESSHHIFSLPFFVANSTPSQQTSSGSADHAQAVGPTVNTGGVMTETPESSVSLWLVAVLLLLSGGITVTTLLRRGQRQR